jgi:hypothetical protein
VFSKCFLTDSIVCKGVASPFPQHSCHAFCHLFHHCCVLGSVSTLGQSGLLIPLLLTDYHRFSLLAACTADGQLSNVGEVGPLALLRSPYLCLWRRACVNGSGRFLPPVIGPLFLLAPSPKSSTSVPTALYTEPLVFSLPALSVSVSEFPSSSLLVLFH